MRPFALLLLSLLSLSPAWSADTEPNTPEVAAKVAEAAKQLPEQYTNRPLLFLPMLDAPKQLKGDLSDPIWEKATPFNLQSMVKGELVPPKFVTAARMFCTSDAIYLGVKCEDPDPANATVSNPAAWQNDSLEFFLFPGESCKGGKLYYQICVDASKKIEFYHTHLYPKNTFGGRSEPWKPAGVECEITKDAKSWTLELKIKYSDMVLPDEVKEKRAIWRMDLFRNRVARGNISAQSMAWAPTDATGSYHLCGRYGYLLPAALVSTDVIGTVLANAKGATTTDTPPAQELSREVTELIGRLGNDDYNVRNTAMLNLNTMVEEKKLGRFIQTQLKKTLSETEDSEVKMRSIKVLKTCYSWLNPDDDTPPVNNNDWQAKE